jgi:hypothetical protein
MSAVSIGHAFDARSRRRARLVDACQHLPASASICHYPGAAPPILPRQEIHNVLFAHAKRHRCWSTVVVGIGPLVFSLSCALSAAAEHGTGICAVPLSSLCRTGGNRLFDPFSFTCVRHKAATYRIHF